MLPVYRGELQTRGLGLSVEVWNDKGESVIDQKGELVCIKTFPSKPTGFGMMMKGKNIVSLISIVILMYGAMVIL